MEVGRLSVVVIGNIYWNDSDWRPIMPETDKSSQTFQEVCATLPVRQVTP